MNKKFLRGILSLSFSSALVLGVLSQNGIFANASISVNPYTSKINESKTKNIASYNTYYGLMHSHSDFSDGEGSCEEAFKYASTKAKQLNFFAVTDHSHSLDNHKSANINDGSMSQEWKEGHRLAKKYTSNNFVGIYGYEMTWKPYLGLGHMNTFNTAGFQSDKQTNYSSDSKGLQNYYKTLQTSPNAISMFNHPSTKWGDFEEFSHYSVETDKIINLIELPRYHNVTSSFSNYCKYYTKALDKGWHISPAANQDNHHKQWGTEDSGRIGLLAKSLTESGIYTAIRNNRTFSTEDYDFTLKYTLNDYMMGAKINRKNVGKTVKIKLQINDPSDVGMGKVEVVVNGGKTIAKSNVKISNTTVTFTVPSSYSYYFVRILQDDGDRIVSAPVWLGDYKVKTTDKNSEYVLSKSNVAYISKNELQSLSKAQLRLARNEIFARHGCIFQSSDLDKYFRSKSWYKPTITASRFNTNNFNKYETANVKAILSYEQR